MTQFDRSIQNKTRSQHTTQRHESPHLLHFIINIFMRNECSKTFISTIYNTNYLSKDIYFFFICGAFEYNFIN